MRLLALLLLLPLYAHSANVEQCWDGLYYTGSCPVQPLAITPDLAPNSTDATVVVNLSAAADMLHVWTKAATDGVCPTAPTVAQVVSGSGADQKDTASSPTLGDNNVLIEGLSENSDYCSWAVATKNGLPSAQSTSTTTLVASIPWFTASVPGDLVKWNPGHYMTPLGLTSQATTLTHYDELDTSTTVKGAVVLAKWGPMEVTEGVYDFSYIQTELDYLAALTVPKRLIVRMNTLNDRTTGNCNTSNNYGIDGRWFPAYIVAMGGCAQTYSSGTLGTYTVKWWHEATKERYKALLTAMAAEFDDHPLFEGIIIKPETSIGANPTLDGTYTAAGYFGALQDVALHAKSVFTTSNVWIGFTFYPQQAATNIYPYLEWARDNGIGLNTQDLAPDCVVANLTCTSGFEAVQGQIGGGSGHLYNYHKGVGTLPEYWVATSGAIPLSNVIDPSVLRSNESVGQDGGYAASVLHRFAQPENASTPVASRGWGFPSTHILWVRMEDANSADSQEWPAIEDLIDATPTVVNPECPQSHIDAGGCLTGDVP